MRTIFAFLVAGWVANLVFALISKDYASIALAVLNLGACGFGVVARGMISGTVGWLSIWIGGNLVIARVFHLPVSEGFVAISMVTIAFAVFVGNRLASD
jgi:hypothetical protein